MEQFDFVARGAVIADDEVGKDVVLDCISDPGNMYKALINIDSTAPHVIQVYAKDANGNSSIVVKTLIVQPQKNVFKQILDRLMHLF